VHSNVKYTAEADSCTLVKNKSRWSW